MFGPIFLKLAQIVHLDKWMNPNENGVNARTVYVMHLQIASSGGKLLFNLFSFDTL